jgi:tripartite-type tricarboxylate transporter receptor subunit TctC
VTWNGLLAPAGVPRGVVDRLAPALVEMARDPSIVRRLRDIGVDAIGSTPAEFAEAIRTDLRSLGEASRAAGLRTDAR